MTGDCVLDATAADASEKKRRGRPPKLKPATVEAVEADDEDDDSIDSIDGKRGLYGLLGHGRTAWTTWTVWTRQVSVLTNEWNPCATDEDEDRLSHKKNKKDTPKKLQFDDRRA